MPTPVQNIYTRFLGKITDYSLSSMLQTDAEEILYGYLRSAKVKFVQCKKNLYVDEFMFEFKEELSELEEEVLAHMMLLEWIQPRLNHLDFMERHLSTKDFAEYSQANHLKELREAKKDIQYDIDNLVVLYGYADGVEGLR